MKESDLAEALDEQHQAFQSFVKNQDARVGKLEAAISTGQHIRAAGDDSSTKFTDRQSREFLSGVIRRDPQLAVTVGDADSGGNAAPGVLSNQILAQIRRLSPLMDLVNVEDSETGQWSKIVTDTGHASGWADEGDSRSETSTAKMHKVSPTFGTLYAVPKVSEEAAADIFFNVENWFRDESAKEFAAQLGSAVVNGSGTARPTGFLQASTAATPDESSPARAFGTIEHIASGVAADFPDDQTASPPGNPGDVLLNAFYALNEAHRQSEGCAWVMNSLTWKDVRSWKDKDGNYLVGTNLVGNSAELLGKPVRIVESMPDIGANTIPVVVADWPAFYTVVRVGPLRVTRDEVTTYGQIKLHVRQRFGGKIMDSNAGKFIKIATS